jgi:hypothetical protein
VGWGRINQKETVMLEIYVSNFTIQEFGINTEAFGVEDQVDQLIFLAMQSEFSEIDDIKATSGPYDSIELWNDEGDQVDPSTINAPGRVANALKSIDWSQVNEEIEAYY